MPESMRIQMSNWKSSIDKWREGKDKWQGRHGDLEPASIDIKQVQVKNVTGKVKRSYPIRIPDMIQLMLQDRYSLEEFFLSSARDIYAMSIIE